MVLVSGYETINSKAFYHISFQIEGQEFSTDCGVQDPQQALRIVRELETKGCKPKIVREICYDTTKSGFLTKDPEHEDLSIERLEEIVMNNEHLPLHREPIIVPDRHGVDIGD